MWQIGRFAARSHAQELGDGNEYTAAEFHEALRDLRRVNRYLGGIRSLRRFLWPAVRQSGHREVSILDVGAGSADLMQAVVGWGRAEGIVVRVTACDLSPYSVAAALQAAQQEPALRVVRADARQLPFSERSFDYVTASMFLHHFDDESAAALLGRFWRLCRRGVVINDLLRHPVAYYGIAALARLFTTNRLVRYDGPVSVLRGFTPEELRALGERAGLNHIEMFMGWAYRVVLRASKSGADE